MARDEPFPIWIAAATAFFVVVFVIGGIWLLNFNRDTPTPSPPPSTGLASPSQARQEMSTAIDEAAAAQDAYRNENAIYASTMTDLKEAGAEIPAEVYITVVSADSFAYCMEATHTDLVSVHLRYAEKSDAPEVGRCE